MYYCIYFEKSVDKQIRFPGFPSSLIILLFKLIKLFPLVILCLVQLLMRLVSQRQIMVLRVFDDNKIPFDEFYLLLSQCIDSFT